MKDITGRVRAISTTIYTRKGMSSLGSSVTMIEITAFASLSGYDTERNERVVLTLNSEAAQILQMVQLDGVYTFTRFRKVLLKDETGFALISYANADASSAAIPFSTPLCFSHFPLSCPDVLKMSENILAPPTIAHKDAFMVTYFNVTGTLLPQNVCPLGWIYLLKCSLFPATSLSSSDSNSVVSSVATRDPIPHEFCKVFFPHYYSRLLFDKASSPSLTPTFSVQNVLPIYGLDNVFEGFSSTIRTSVFCSEYPRLENIHDFREILFSIPRSISDRCTYFCAWISSLVPKISSCLQRDLLRQLKISPETVLEYIYERMEVLKEAADRCLLQERSFLQEFVDVNYSDLFIIRNGMDSSYIQTLLPKLLSTSLLTRRAEDYNNKGQPGFINHRYDSSLTAYGSSSVILLSTVLNYILLPNLTILSLVDATNTAVLCFVSLKNVSFETASEFAKNLNSFSKIVLVAINPIVLTVGLQSPKSYIVAVDLNSVLLFDLLDLQSSSKFPAAAADIQRKYLLNLVEVEHKAHQVNQSISAFYASFIYRSQGGHDGSMCKDYISVRRILACSDAGQLWVDCIGVIMSILPQPIVENQAILTMRDLEYFDHICVYVPKDLSLGLFQGLEVKFSKLKALVSSKHKYLLFVREASFIGDKATLSFFNCICFISP